VAAALALRHRGSRLPAGATAPTADAATAAAVEDVVTAAALSLVAVRRRLADLAAGGTALAERTPPELSTSDLQRLVELYADLLGC
jgi:hypothetical protein